MDQIGELELAWSQGYTGSKALYIDKETICFKCGSCIKFVNDAGSSQQYFPSAGDGVGVLAVHPINKVFAFSEACLEPKIFVFSYPLFDQVAEMFEGASLDFSHVAFSSTIYMLSVSSLPEFQLIVWNYELGQKLCSANLACLTPSSVSFNPVNWRQICVTTATSIEFWNSEIAEERANIFKESVTVPSVNMGVSAAEEKERDEMMATRASTRLSKITVALPRAAIAGLVGEFAETFDEFGDDVGRVSPVSQCWTPHGSLFVGCEQGHLLLVDAETMKVSMVYNPGYVRRTSDIHLRDVQTADSLRTGDRAPSEMSIKSSKSAASVGPSIGEGAFNFLVLNKQHLFAGGLDGTLRVIDADDNGMRVIDSVPLGNAITSMAFNTYYKTIAIGSSKGTIHLYTPEDSKDVEFMDCHYGTFVGLSVLVPGESHCVSVRMDGEVQCWMLDSGKLISTLPIGIQATSLMCSPLAHLAAVGSVAGHVYIIDFTKVEFPRIVERLKLHSGPVNHIQFDLHGHIMVTGSNDDVVMVTHAKPSKMFQPLGYIDVAGQVRAVAINTDQNTGTHQIVATFNDGKESSDGANRLVVFYLTEQQVQAPPIASLKCDLIPAEIQLLVFNFSAPAYGAALAGTNVLYCLNGRTKQIQMMNIPTVRPKKEYSKDSYLVGDFTVPGHELSGGMVELSLHKQWLTTCSPDGYVTVRLIQSMQRSVTRIFPHSYNTGGVNKFCLTPDGQKILTTGHDGILSCYKWRGSEDQAHDEFSTPVEDSDQIAREPSGQIAREPSGQIAKETSGQIAREPSGQIAREPSGQIASVDSGQMSREDSGRIVGVDAGRIAREAALQHFSGKVEETLFEDAAMVDMNGWTPAPMPSRSQTTSHEQLPDALEQAIENNEIYCTPTPTPSADASWREVKAMEAVREEDKQYFDQKQSLRIQIRDMRRQLQAMMKENEEVPDIQKLGRHEFDLDIDEQVRLHQEGETEVLRIRQQIEFDNLAKMYLRELIKMQCFDEMVVKGRAISAFNSILEVSNYPLRARPETVMAELARVQAQRRVEMAELKERRAVLEATQKTAAAQEEDVDEDNAGGDGKAQPAITGSSGAQFGGASEYFYSQFELHTRRQKMNQIVLLEDAIHRMKLAFNRDFDDVMVKKEQEIGKIKEKNKRIRKIIEDLELAEAVDEPAMGLGEKPERLLTVEDSEITVEKFLTPEQMKKLEGERKAEEERLAREKGDNARERALDMMMGGVLEVKKEDELKKDIPIPGFITAKQVEDWTEDEQKLAKDYERRVKELNEEREKFRKQLETELKKLQGFIQEGTQTFDDILSNLFSRKIKTEMVIYQEELKIVRLKYTILVTEEMETRDQELQRLMEHKREVKVHAVLALAESKKNVEEFTDLYDLLSAEDKLLDKAFKREFHDVSAVMVEQLYKLFKKRPRAPRLKEDTAAGHAHTAAKSANPFIDRPSTAKQQDNAKAHMEAALDEMDKEANMPEGLDPVVWERLCHFRRAKVEKEQLIKQKALVLAEMNSFVQKRSNEDEQISNEINDIMEEINLLRDHRLRYQCNLEVQLLLKQGQVEVDAGAFIHDFRNSVLIHRSVVEDLNTKIRNLGEMKIASMVESKDFRKGIVHQEWEHKKMLMEMEDLKNKMRDIQMLKVTREIQAFLHEDDFDGKKAEEIGTLEQTILTQKANHEKHLTEKRRATRDLNKSVREKQECIKELDRVLEELNVSVNERRHIEEVHADKKFSTGAEQRYQDIVQRRKLVDLAKAQAQEVAVLRAEVERLRMRTFPALVQVDRS